MGAVFVTYNGLLDPLGPSQILPYVERLHRRRPMTILSFERPDRMNDLAALAALSGRLAAQGIGWTRLRYHKWPSLAATTWDLLAGARALRKLASSKEIGLVHARGYLPSAIALRARTGVPLLFDIRGLQPEEYVDGGIWREGELKHRLAKRAERRFFQSAAGAVVLTEAIKPYVASRFAENNRQAPIEVIPCCVDPGRFRFEPDARRQIRSTLHVGEETVVFVYSGSVGTWYLSREMAEFVVAFRERTGRSVHLLWLVNGDQENVLELGLRAGLTRSETTAASVGAEDVPRYLSASDVATALIRPCFSKRSSSPTKYAECLAAGLPLVICGNVGDGKAIVERRGAADYAWPATKDGVTGSIDALVALLSLPREHFAGLARELFDIDRIALPRYERLYEAILK